MEIVENSTTSALLDGLELGTDEGAWREVDASYRPVIIGFGQRLGLNASDAADAAQETLLDLFTSFRDHRYDRQRGRLRAWILGIAKCRIADIRRGYARRHRGLHDFAVARPPSDDDELAVIWVDECRKTILVRAMSQLAQSGRFRPRTLDAFRLVALEGNPAAGVARALGMPVASVYQAKHHCLQRLRAIVIGVALEYGVDPHEMIRP